MQANPLWRFVNGAPPKVIPGEQCEFCSKPIDGAHSHLVDVKDRRLLCACRPCFLLFTPRGAAQGRYKASSERYLHLSGFTLSNAQWEALQIPINLAFFFYNSSTQKMAAFYPSPAGATESLLSLQMWDEIVATNPDVATMEPDVEALLIYRPKDAQLQAYLVPIDVCYELVGVIRKSWKGFAGGEEAWTEIGRFFDELHMRASGLTRQRVL